MNFADDPLMPLLGRGQPEKICRDLASTLAWSVEAHLERLADLESRKNTTHQVLSKQVSICTCAVGYCFDLGIRPGIRTPKGSACPLLDEQLARRLCGKMTLRD